MLENLFPKECPYKENCKGWNPNEDDLCMGNVDGNYRSSQKKCYQSSRQGITERIQDNIEETFCQVFGID